MKMMVKKILLVLVLLGLVFVVLNLLNIKSNFSYKVINGAKISVNSGSGNLSLSSTSEKSTVSGLFSHKILTKPRLKLVSNELVMISNKADGEINLPSDISFSNISLTMGAGNISLNLKNAKIDKLSVTSGASNIKLLLPQDTSSKLDFVIGAGNLSLVIPTGGELGGVKIVSSSLSNMSLGEMWVRTSDGIETKNFKDAKVTSVIDLSKGDSVSLDITGEK